MTTKTRKTGAELMVVLYSSSITSGVMAFLAAYILKDEMKYKYHRKSGQTGENKMQKRMALDLDSTKRRFDTVIAKTADKFNVWCFWMFLNAVNTLDFITKETMDCSNANEARF